MPKTECIELPEGETIPILYEDRSVIAIDKPAGWMLVPFSWQRTNRNLQAALTSSIAAGDFWARSRNLKFLKFIHRLDAETSGVLLFGKSPGAVETLSYLFESRQMEKVYLAVSASRPPQERWVCRLSLSQDPQRHGQMLVDAAGKSAETECSLVAEAKENFLIEARPYTGRTHQIRLHLAHSGCPIIGDSLYGSEGKQMGLRAAGLAYRNPFDRKMVFIRAPLDAFLKRFGFGPRVYQLRFDEKGLKNLNPGNQRPKGEQHQDGQGDGDHPDHDEESHGSEQNPGR